MKVIQIATMGGDPGELFALTEAGHIYRLVGDETALQWQELPPIPDIIKAITEEPPEEA